MQAAQKVVEYWKKQPGIIDKLSNLTEDDGVVQELVACRIIYSSTQLGNMMEGFSHNISDLAWNYIHSNPSILQGTTNVYGTDKRKSLW